MFVVLCILWVIWNGRLTAEIVVTGVVICAVLYMFLYKFMGYRPEKEWMILKCMPQIFRYLVFLFVEVVKSNLMVSRLILSFDTEPEPVLVRFQPKLRTETGRTVLANSITLTPGTLTVDMDDSVCLVHSLDQEFAEGIEQSEFADRIEKMEAAMEVMESGEKGIKET